MEASLYRAELLTSNVFERHWPNISEQLDTIPHVWEKWWTKDFLHCAPLAGRCQVWGIGDEKLRIIVYTQIINYPASSIFQIFLAFGNDIERCLPIMDALFEKVAKDSGCGSIEVIGRPGWERKLQGFTRTAVILTRAVQQHGVH